MRLSLLRSRLFGWLNPAALLSHPFGNTSITQSTSTAWQISSTFQQSTGESTGFNQIRFGYKTSAKPVRKGRRKSRILESSDDEEDVTGPIITTFRNLVMAKSTPIEKKEQCAKEALAQIDFLNINEIANILFACGRSGYVHGELFEAVAKRAVTTQGMMIQMLPGNTRLIFQAMVLLGRLGEEELKPFPSRRRFCKTLVGVTIKQERGRFMDTNEYNMTTTLHCVGKLHKVGMITKGEAVNLVGVLMYRLGTENRISRCTPQELSHVLHGCALVGYVGRAELKRVCEQIQCLLVIPRASLKIMTTTFSPPIVASIIWSLGKLGVSDGLRMDVLGERLFELLPVMSGRELVETLHGFVSLEYTNREILDELCVELCKPTRTVSLTTQELVNLLYAISRLGYEEDVIGGLIKEVTKPKRLVELNRPAVCTVVQSIGQMESVGQEVIEPLLEEVMEPRRMEMAREKCDRHLCSFVYGLGLLHSHLDNTSLFTGVCRFLDSVRVMSATKDLSCRDIACMTWGLAKLQFYSKWFMDRLASQFLRAMEVQNSERLEQDSLMLLYACAVLDHQHPKFLDFMVKAIEPYAQAMDEIRSVTTAIWGLAVLGRLNQDVFATLCSRLSLIGSIEKPEDAMQFLQGWRVVNKARGGNSLKVHESFEDMVLDLVEVAKRVLKQHRQHSGMSQFETDVVNAIKALGVDFQQKVFVDEDLGIEVDCLVEGPTPIAVEVDGPTHYTSNVAPGGTYQELGATKFRNQVLKDLGYKVVCIPFFIWDGLSSEEQEGFLKDYLLEDPPCLPSESESG